MDELHWFLDQVEINNDYPALKQLLAGPPQATHRRASCAGCSFLIEKDSARDDLIAPQSLIDTSGRMPPPPSVLVNRRAQGDNTPKSFLEQMAERLDPTKPLQPDAMLPGLAPYMGENEIEGITGQTIDRCGMLEEAVYSLKPVCRYTHWQAQGRKEFRQALEDYLVKQEPQKG